MQVNGTVKKVFLLLGVLLLIFIIWQLVFNDGGIIMTGYNAVADGINAQWQKAAGDSSTLLPRFGDNGNDNNGKAFDIDTGTN